MYLLKVPKVKEEKKQITSSTVLTPAMLRRHQFGPRDNVVFNVKKIITQKTQLTEGIIKDYIENIKNIQDLQYLNPQMLSLCYIISNEILYEGEIMSDIDYAPKLKTYFANTERVEKLTRAIYDIKQDDKVDIKRYEENIVRYFVILTKNRCL
jgi:hypothetical protein